MPRGFTRSLLLSLVLVLSGTTIVFAGAFRVGFDNPEYLINPGTNQQIYAELFDEGGNAVTAAATTYVYLTPGTSSAQISSKITTPTFASSGATVKITIARGDRRKSFLYRDSVLGESFLTATSSGLTTGNLKITIGFPPPPPEPISAPVTTVSNQKTVAKIIPSPPEVDPTPPEVVGESTVSTIVKPYPQIEPAVLSEKDSRMKVVWVDQFQLLITWFMKLWLDIISL